MLNYKLAQAAEQLGPIQEKALNRLQKNMIVTDSAFDKYQMADMAKVLELDIACRAELEALHDMISRIEITDILYAAFTSDTARILDVVDGCTLPPDYVDACSLAREVAQSGIRLSAEEIFTVISIMITAVALCLTQLPLALQQNVIKRLDVLLEIKEKQLSLMRDLKRWNEDFMR